MGGLNYVNEFMMDGEIATSVVGVFAVIYLLFILLAGAFSMVCYVLLSLGTFTIAERRGIRHAWLAWVPVGNLWILGSISDQYQYVAKGKVKNRRKILVGLYIAIIVLYLVMLFSMIIGAVGGDAVPILVGTLGGMLLLFAVAVGTAVVQYMALYDLYQSCQPSNAVLYLVLSIVFSVTMPFFVFACRKKDLGMPPRKQAPAQQTVTVPAQTFTVPEQTFTVPEQTVAAPVETEPVQQTPAEGYAQPEEFEE